MNNQFIEDNVVYFGRTWHFFLTGTILILMGSSLSSSLLFALMTFLLHPVEIAESLGYMHVIFVVALVLGLYLATSIIRQGIYLCNVHYEITSEVLTITTRQGDEVIRWGDVSDINVSMGRQAWWYMLRLKLRNGKAVSIIPDPSGLFPERPVAVLVKASQHPHLEITAPKHLEGWPLQSADQREGSSPNLTAPK